MGLIRSYTAKEIHAALLAKNLILLQGIISAQKKEYKYLPANMEVELKVLSGIGLGNTKNAGLIKEEKERIEEENRKIQSFNESIDFERKRLQFIKDTISLFGDKVLIVSYSDFEYIIKKYNLVCGMLEQYSGSIPKENIDEFMAVREIIYSFDNDYMDRYIKNLFFVKDYKVLGLDIFPFCYLKRVEEKSTSFRSEAFDTIFHSIYGVNKFYHIISKNKTIKENSINISNDSFPFFIAAPKKDMDFSESFLEKLMPKPKDPFICSYTDYGIIVHTKWGEESEDEVLRKYYKQIKALEE